MRTASAGLVPPPAPLLETFELGAFAFEPDALARDDLGFDDLGFARLAVLGLARFAFAFDFDWFFDCDLGFDFDCEFELGDFALLDEPAPFDADRFFGLVSAIFSLSSGSPY
ncbi:MAG TPA: hypothetical protein VFN85_00425 [Solirubrobacterales bacterium]|nr:hypothetical protein [Solirubrobacterales bacterium]